MVVETMCRMCGNEPIDPITGSYELCGLCYRLLEIELDDYDKWCEEFMEANPDFEDCPF